MDRQDWPHRGVRRQRTHSRPFPAHPWNCIAQFSVWGLIVVLYCAMRRWRRGNIAIEYNTSTAALSTLGATPAAQESGGQILPQQTRKTGTAEAQSLQHIISHPADSCAFSSCSAFQARVPVTDVEPTFPSRPLHPEIEGHPQFAWQFVDALVQYAATFGLDLRSWTLRSAHPVHKSSQKFAP